MTDFINENLQLYANNPEIIELIKGFLEDRKILAEEITAYYAAIHQKQMESLLKENEKIGKQLASALNSLDCPMLSFDLPDDKE